MLKITELQSIEKCFESIVCKMYTYEPQPAHNFTVPVGICVTNFSICRETIVTHTDKNSLLN